MKKVFLFLFIHFLALLSYSQTELEKLLSQKQTLPDDWVSLITSHLKWNVIDWSFIGDRSRKIYPPNPAWKTDENKTTFYRFAAGNVSKFPALVDSFNTTLPVVYFAAEGTFYSNNIMTIEDKTISFKQPYQIFYLDSTTLVLEQLNDLYFDFDTGKILSTIPSNSKAVEITNRTDHQSPSYNVTDRSKKKSKGKNEEAVRIVELLSINNN